MSVKCSSLCGQYKLYVMLCRCQNGTASQYVMAHCVPFLKIASWQHLTFGCQPLTNSSIILAEHVLCLRRPIWIELAAQTCTQFLPTAVPFSANSLKHFFSQSTDVHRALEAFDDALYKFIFYITLDYILTSTASLVCLCHAWPVTLSFLDLLIIRVTYSTVTDVLITLLLPKSI